MRGDTSTRMTDGAGGAERATAHRQGEPGVGDFEFESFGAPAVGLVGQVDMMETRRLYLAHVSENRD